MSKKFELKGEVKDDGVIAMTEWELASQNLSVESSHHGDLLSLVSEMDAV